MYDTLLTWFKQDHITWQTYKPLRAHARCTPIQLLDQREAVLLCFAGAPFCNFAILLQVHPQGLDISLKS